MKVVYFSRTGVSRQLAEDVASRHGLPTVEIRDGKNWKGLIGYIKAGFYASTDRSVNITTSVPVEPTEAAVVVAPLWAGTLAPAAKAFLRERDPANTAVVIVSLGSISSWPENRSAFAFIGDVVKSRDNREEIRKELDTFLNSRREY